MTEELLYAGKVKEVYLTEEANKVKIKFADKATAGNGQKSGQIEAKGRLNTEISAHLFTYLENEGISTHFLEQTGLNEMLAEKVDIIPIEVVLRNVAAGSLSRRLGIPEGEELSPPLVEFYYKDDALDDPLLTEDHIQLLNLAGEDVVAELKRLGLLINSLLVEYFQERNIILVDFKLEFGFARDGSILLADEISPDTCRFWDAETKDKLDKDRFRNDMGQVEEAYQEILQRITGKVIQ